jgi:ABC-type nickel/cobalt efflux system permease component RcnA
VGGGRACSYIWRIAVDVAERDRRGPAVPATDSSVRQAAAVLFVIKGRRLLPHVRQALTRQHTHTHTHTFAYTHTLSHTQTHILTSCMPFSGGCVPSAYGPISLHTHTHTHTHTHGRTHARTHMRTRTRTRTRTHARTHARTHTLNTHETHTCPFPCRR